MFGNSAVVSSLEPLLAARLWGTHASTGKEEEMRRFTVLASLSAMAYVAAGLVWPPL
jgi:hypothetical protein